MTIKIGDIVQCRDGSYSCRVDKNGDIKSGDTSYRYLSNLNQTFKVIGIFDLMLPMWNRNRNSKIINNVMMVDKDGLTVFSSLVFLRLMDIAPEEWPECTQYQ